ncbi:hypothetical protein VAEU17_4400272 [Vibrio aestuarianus]|nr:hypothetical protein VAEU17_4400272 [Vibrio aestuarianus]
MILSLQQGIASVNQMQLKAGGKLFHLLKNIPPLTLE